MSQTESYIVLKPISERFAEVANSITDSEIKEMIKSELRTRIRDAIKESVEEGIWNLTNLVETLIQDNEDFIANEFKQGVVRRLG